MSTFKGLFWLLSSIPLICFCNCQDGCGSTDQRFKQLEDFLLEIKDDMIGMEKRIRDTIDAAKSSLRVELKETIRDQVRETIGEIVQGETFRDIVKGEVASGLHHVKRGFQKMNGQLQNMSGSLRDMQEETATFHEFVRKKVDLWNGQNTSDTCAREKHKLELELEKRNVSVAELKLDNERLLELNEWCQFQISQLETALSVYVSPGASHHVNSTSTSPVLTTVRPHVLTPSLTTPMPDEDRSRILVAQVRSHTHQQFREFNIHDNSLSVYPYHNMSRVTCVAYSARKKELLVGLYQSDRILASTLDTSQLRVLSEGVRTFGMAVDEGRGVAFIGIYRPKPSISRMSTQGGDLTTVINLSNYSHVPRQIALDTRRKKIYWCHINKLFTATYDGQGQTTLVTGWDMFGVALDQTAGVLYYNNREELMRMTVSNNVSTRVITLNATPRNMILYRGIIYYGGWHTPVVYRVNVTHNTGAYSLESKSIKGLWNAYLCLTD